MGLGTSLSHGGACTPGVSMGSTCWVARSHRGATSTGQSFHSTYMLGSLHLFAVSFCTWKAQGKFGELGCAVSAPPRDKAGSQESPVVNAGSGAREAGLLPQPLRGGACVHMLPDSFQHNVDTDSLQRHHVLALCQALQIKRLAYSTLSRGWITSLAHFTDKKTKALSGR
jgi:hypothetical protein